MIEFSLAFLHRFPTEEVELNQYPRRRCDRIKNCQECTCVVLDFIHEEEAVNKKKLFFAAQGNTLVCEGRVPR